MAELPNPTTEADWWAVKKQQRRLWYWTASYVGGVQSAPTLEAERAHLPVFQNTLIYRSKRGNNPHATCDRERTKHPKDVVLQPLLILWMRADFTNSGRHGALSLTSLYCRLLAGLKGTGLMPVAVASLLLMQLHHKPNECEVVVAHPILTGHSRRSAQGLMRNG